MSLREVQQALSHLIRAPEGVAKALAEGSTREEDRSRPLWAGATSFLRSDDKGEASARLEIYANAYFYRILGVLELDFPTLKAALGSELFHDLVTSYLLAHPPSHPSLRHAGMALPDFLAASPATEGVRARAPWAADLAAFEWARVDVFDGADHPILDADSVARLSPDEFGALALKLGDWAVIRAFDSAVDALFESIEEDETVKPPPPAREATSLIVWRRRERVVHRRLSSLEENALSLVSLGTHFGTLCEYAAQEVGDDEAPAMAAGWLSQWLSDELLVRS